MFPRLNFHVIAFDEGWMFACQGEFQGAYSDYDCFDATPEMYEAVYGYPPPKEEE